MILTLLAAVIVLSIIIFVHELGHFLAAKRSGVRVEVFSMGFGPKLLKLKRGDTEYAVSAVPFGGYVKMAGADPDQETTGSPWEFLSKSKRTRALIVLSGPAMNFALGVVIYSVLTYHAGIPTVSTRTIGEVAEHSPAFDAGLRADDRVLAVDGRSVATWDELSELVQARLGGRVEIAVDRDGAATSAVLDLGGVKELSQVGMSPFEEAVVDDVKRDGPAFRAGLRGGDRITRIGERPIRSWEDVRQAVRSSPLKEITIVWERQGREYSSAVIPRAEGGYGLIDVTYRFETKPVSLVRAFKLGLETAVFISKQLFTSLRLLVSGQASRDMIGGPVRIGQIAGETWRWGVATFLAFIAALSAQLALVNLLPVPVLDGGHILLLGVEAVARRPATVRQRMIVQQVGLAFLIFFMLVITFVDVSRYLWK